MAKLEGVKTIDMVNGEITKVEYGGEVYAKVDVNGVAEVGDLVLITDDSWVHSTEGMFYTCEALSDINPRISDDRNEYDSNYYDGSYELFRKQAAPTLDERVSVLETKVASLEGEEKTAEIINHNGAEYTLVDRKAQPGDVVIIPKGGGSPYFEEGKMYEVADEFDDVKVTAYGNNGKHYRLYNEMYDRTQDNVKVYEPVAKSEPLKVGDYAKVAPHVSHDGYAGAGDIVKLHDNTGGCYDFKCTKPGDESGSTLFNASELVRATDEEVAEAKRQTEQAEIEAKWASIGRKPSEFKKGDIVHSENGAAEFTVLAADEIITGKVSFESRRVDLDKVVLVTPVESRFDRE
ncbi:hypothetical protein [Cytobacillus purgationiresistens]|uniref:Hemin uptake protein HemP n=1 Tax=Cytobacillus purgationiresistens TaxID=863449 RepID=A0ABU0AIQ3_9BACI|nr:hypothetical protein [Cytobacillus purgationiresistens]MDQ0270769.1 hemin uptake protein HemP [Cytobacillus purgationiresistens]